MRIAFYAPLKSPDHPVPSGDRLMARQLMAALRLAGHEVTLASSLRAYLGQPDDAAGLDALQRRAEGERARLAEDWAGGAPDLWFCYHSYYKSPDLIGPPICAGFGVPIVTVETSWSARRNVGIWTGMQAAALAGARQAAVNLCFTARDERGLRAVDAGLRLARLSPFIDPAPANPGPEALHLVTVAMMRPGDKVESFRALAAALAKVDLPWRLSVAGDGVAAGEVRAMFAGMPGQVQWLGRLEAAGVQALLARGAVYVWPGCGEAYGLAYLEAQAAGLPVVAYATAGVPEVVEDGVTGTLVPEGDTGALARAIGMVLTEDGMRAQGVAAALAGGGLCPAGRDLARSDRAMMERLKRALDARAKAGRPVAMWLRDDDAVEPTPALDRLFDLARLGVPLTVAAIPAGSGVALAQAVAAVTGVEVAQHGWSHANHAGAGEKKQELGGHRPLQAVMEELARGFSHLSTLHGPRFVPLMVPPWNRIDPDVTAALPGLGFRALSVYGPVKPGPLPQINTQVDLIDWHGTRGGREMSVLEAEVIAAMETGPVGILTHHLVHDAAAWGFLDALVVATMGHPGGRWVPVSALLP